MTDKHGKRLVKKPRKQLVSLSRIVNNLKEIIQGDYKTQSNVLQKSPLYIPKTSHLPYSSIEEHKDAISTNVFMRFFQDDNDLVVDLPCSTQATDT